MNFRTLALSLTAILFALLALSVQAATQANPFAQPNPFATNNKAKFNPKDHVKQFANGDVIIQGVPMVAQNKNKDDIIANIERLLQYYERSGGQKMLKQIADTSSHNHHDIWYASATFLKLAPKLGLLGMRSQTLMPEPDDLIENLVPQYNALARVNKKPLANASSDTIWEHMDPKLLRKIRATPAAESILLQKVKPYIDQGRPLLWKAMAGFLPEKKVRFNNIGPKMRLIIGYNPKTNEIIYSDTYGRGYEVERMSLSDACTMSMALYLVEPIDN